MSAAAVVEDQFADDNQPLVDYEEPVENSVVEQQNSELAGSYQTKGSYVGKQASGFRDFLLKPELLRAIGDCGFEHPSEVQQACIPSAAFGTDLICQAKSGMGKTAVFVLSVLQQIQPTKSDSMAKDIFVDTLVLCHARELAYQIAQEFDRFSKYLNGVKTTVIFGGIPESQNIKSLRENPPNIIVGTPGRVLGLANRQILRLNHLKRFILDECDKMLDALDMRRDVQAIFQQTPHEKQVLMFSATINKKVREVCRKFAREPREIFVDDESKLTLHGLQQFVKKMRENEKTSSLFNLLDMLEFNQVVIFVRTIERAKELNLILREAHFPSIAMHSRLTQTDRIDIYTRFKSYQSRILVTTDLLGRGVDIERVNVVVNYDMPDDEDAYLHRVGRAGRFGTKGLAISFVVSDEDTSVLENVQKRFEVQVKEMPEIIEKSSYMTTN